MPAPRAPLATGSFGPLLLLFALVAGLAALARSGAPKPPPPPPGPEIVFAETRLEFGQVPHGTVVSHRFRFWNQGAGRLDVLGVETSCGCVASAPSRRSLAPGEEAYLEARFDSRTKQPTAFAQGYKNQVLVRTNDRTDPEVVLSLEGAVYSRFRLAPAGGAIFPVTPVVGAPPPSEPALVDVYPQGGTLAALHAAKVESAPRGVRVEGPFPHASEQGQEGVRFRVFLTRDFEPGPMRERIEVATGDPEHPALSIPVIATARASVIPSAGALYLPVRTERRLELAASAAVERPGPVRVVRALAIEDRGGEPSLDLEPRADGLGGEVFYGTLLRARGGAARAPGAPPASPGRGVVRFLVADPFTPVIEVPYRLIDQAARAARVEQAKAARALVTPPDIELRSYDAGTDQLVRVTVSSIGPGLDLRDVEVSGSPWLSASHEPVQGDRVARILLHVRAARAGPIDGVLRFRPRPGDPLIEVPISGQIAPRLSARPLGIYLARGTLAGSVRVGRRDEAGLGEPLAIERVEAVDPRLRVRATAGGYGDTVIEVDASALPEGDFETAVRIYAAIPDEPPLTIPVFGTR